MALVRESGYDALAMEAIAEREGVAKTTVYRRWPTKELLVAEAIERHLLAVFAPPDTGSVERDVLALMNRARRMYAEPGTASPAARCPTRRKPEARAQRSRSSAGMPRVRAPNA